MRFAVQRAPHSNNNGSLIACNPEAELGLHSLCSETFYRAKTDPAE
jgi:hypothetical protein